MLFLVIISTKRWICYKTHLSKVLLYLKFSFMFKKKMMVEYAAHAKR